MVAGKISSGSIFPEIKGSKTPSILEMKSISIKKNVSMDKQKVMRKARGATINAKMKNCKRLSS